jgi:hypothetical protein
MNKLHSEVLRSPASKKIAPLFNGYGINGDITAPLV